MQYCSWDLPISEDVLLEPKMSGRFSRTIYVGNLPSDIKEGEVEDLFYKVQVSFFNWEQA